MSLIAEVIDMLAARGTATVDDLMPMFPNHTKAQVRNALRQARYERRVVCEGQRRRIGDGVGRGTLPAIYSAKPRPRVTCVWDLAHA